MQKGSKSLALLTKEIFLLSKRYSSVAIIKVQKSAIQGFKSVGRVSSQWTPTSNTQLQVTAEHPHSNYILEG